MAVTPHLDVTYLETAQAQKETTANEAFARLEALQNTAVLDKDLTAPPGSPANGDVYIVGASATGAWASHDDDIAYYNEGWKFIAPNAGALVWVADEGTLYRYTGSFWLYVITAKDSGQVALTAGAATVTNWQVGANSNILLTSQSDGGTPGFLRVTARTPGTSFTITSSSGADTSTIGWVLF